MDVAFSAIGNVSIDDLVFVDGTTRWCVPGGNAIYAGLGMAVWGARPSVVAPIGPEYPVADLGDRLDLSHCRKLDRTLRDWGLYEEDGSRRFIFRMKTSNWREFCPVTGDLAGIDTGAGHVAPLPWDLQIAFAESMKASGAKTVSIDPDDRYLDQLDRADMVRLFNAIDLFLPSKQDVEALMPGRSMLDALRAIRETAPEMPLIAIKRGADGVVMHAKGQSDYLELPTVAETVVDATGAGDAFSGGTLVGFATTGSPIEAVLRGSVSASFAVAEIGPAGLVAATEMQAMDRLERLRCRVDAHPF